MRTVAIALLLSLLTTACLGRQAHPRREAGTEDEGKQEEKKDEKKEPSAHDTVGAFLHALRDNQTAAAWEHLSRRSRDELGPEERQFADQAFPKLKQMLDDWKEYRLLDHKDEEAIAVAVVTRERGTAALPLRLDAGSWKVEAGIGPRVTPISPEPEQGVSNRNVRLAHRVSGGKETIKQIWTWLDEELVSLHGAGEYDADISSSAELRDGLDEGKHFVAVLARDGKGDLGAHVWSFTANDPGGP